MGMQTAMGRSVIPVLQGRCVGGSTVVNAAIVHRMPTSIWDIWVREAGADQGYQYSDLERAWSQIEPELSVGPAPAAVLGENSRIFGEVTKARGIKAHPISRNVKDCEGSSQCNQGCRGGRKQSMNVSYVPRALAGGARVYATCKAEKILTRGGRASGIAGRFIDPITRKRGPRLRVKARKAVIVAASAIQTPLLLRANGIGRRSQQIGERFQAHPGTAVVGVLDKPVDLFFGATQGYDSLHFYDERMKLETISLPPELLAARLPGFGAELIREAAHARRLVMWAVQVRARAHGRVRPAWIGNGASISYDPLNEDVRLLKRGVTILAGLMRDAGAREIYPGIAGMPERVSSPDAFKALETLPDDPRLFHCIASHLFGTATLHADPRRGVLKPTGEAHELPGLWVADSSAFPTNMGVNPQHTICAWAWVVAERIARS
jgi:choline dehydrogenase-like flavoprotein